ncbi:hypothetical protein pVco7_gp023 [Vibrio phage pVco-7]
MRLIKTSTYPVVVRGLNQDKGLTRFGEVGNTYTMRINSMRVVVDYASSTGSNI